MAAAVKFMTGFVQRILDMYTRLVTSWLAAALVIFIAFGSAALRMDDYPIYVDGLFSLATAGYFEESADVALVLERLAEKSHQHVPGYFLLLHGWARLVDWSPFALRLISLASGIFSLALIYRIGRDFISREAGFWALFMLASLYYYNLWYLPIRMYSMFAATGLLALWLYLRALRQPPTRLGWALLCLSIILFAYTHIFSFSLLCGIGVYHLVFVKKDRRWLGISAAFGAAGLAFLPWLGILARGLDYATDRAEQAIHSLSALGLLEAIISFGINASLPFLLLLPLALWQAWRRDRIAIALWTLLAATLAFYVIVNALTGVIDYSRSRYAVIVFPLLILLLAKGMTPLSRWKPLTIGILLFWLASGMLYQRRVGPALFIPSYGTLPAHLVERQLRGELRPGDLLTGFSGGVSFAFKSIAYDGVGEFYFAAHGVDVAIAHTWRLGRMTEGEISAELQRTLEGRERVWLAYQAGKVDYLGHWREALQREHVLCQSDDSLERVHIELHQLEACDSRASG